MQEEQVAHKRRLRLWRHGTIEYLSPTSSPSRFVMPPGPNEVILVDPWSDISDSGPVAVSRGNTFAPVVVNQTIAWNVLRSSIEWYPLYWNRMY